MKTKDKDRDRDYRATVSFSNRMTLSLSAGSWPVREVWRAEGSVFGEPSECLKDRFSLLRTAEEWTGSRGRQTPAAVKAGDGKSTQLTV